MRRLSADADLSPPEFKSDREGDSFCVTVFLHNLLSEDDHAWLRTLTSEPLDDEETKVLIYARATGAVDNSACRDFSGMDTLTASRVLRRLRDRGLLEKHGTGNRTYYSLQPTMQTGQSMVGLPESMVGSSEDLFTHCLSLLPTELAEQARSLYGQRLPKQQLLEHVLQLCSGRFLSLDQLAALLGKNRKYLMNEIVRPLVQAGQLQLRYPESNKHPHQAYVTAEKL